MPNSTLPARKFALDYGRNKLAEMRGEGVRRVEIRTAGDGNVCDGCAELDGKIFDIDQAPLLPVHEESTGIIDDEEEGEVEDEIPICRCIYFPVI